jgi:hypothetical protein
LLVIIATNTCGKPVCKVSAWTMSAERNLALRKFELGNNTKTTSPRL